MMVNEDNVVYTVTLTEARAALIRAHHVSIQEDGMLCFESSAYGTIAAFKSDQWLSFTSALEGLS